jgi:hypothetical protein
MISIQAGWRGAACTAPHVIEATTRVPRVVLLRGILPPCDLLFVRRRPAAAIQVNATQRLAATGRGVKPAVSLRA